MAVYTTPANTDTQDGPFDGRVYFYDGTKAHGVSHPAGDIALVQGTGGNTAANVFVRLDSNGLPLDNRTIWFDGKAAHEDISNLGDQALPGSSGRVFVSRNH